MLLYILFLALFCFICVGFGTQFCSNQSGVKFKSFDLSQSHQKKLYSFLPVQVSARQRMGSNPQGFTAIKRLHSMQVFWSKQYCLSSDVASDEIPVHDHNVKQNPEPAVLITSEMVSRIPEQFLEKPDYSCKAFCLDYQVKIFTQFFLKSSKCRIVTAEIQMWSTTRFLLFFTDFA